MKGKLIVIEGTDCSGKETQSKLLIEKLNKKKIDVEYFSYPNYFSPTGKIIGLPFLGKSYLAHELLDDVKEEVKEKLTNIDSSTVDKVLYEAGEALSKGWFKEGAPNVEGKVASLYYAADRLYNNSYIMGKVNAGTNLILDRYVYSNMAHQAGKLEEESKRNEMYKWLNDLEFKNLGLPTPDIKFFLHMPVPYINLLKAKREEKLDELEKDVSHLYKAEKAYLEIAKKYKFIVIECIKNSDSEVSLENIKTIEEINDEIYEKVINLIK